MKIIDPQGRPLATLGTGQTGKGVGVFRMPDGGGSAGDVLWLSVSGNDWVVE